MSLPLNRSFLVLLVVLPAVAVATVGRALVTVSSQPAAPVFAPAENPDPIAPAVDIPTAPFPATETAAPASVRPAAQTAAPAATALPAASALPHATVPAGPATAHAPDRDIHAIAPEPGMPGFDPPPGRD